MYLMVNGMAQQPFSCERAEVGYSHKMQLISSVCCDWLATVKHAFHCCYQARFQGVSLCDPRVEQCYPVVAGRHQRSIKSRRTDDVQTRRQCYCGEVPEIGQGGERHLLHKNSKMRALTTGTLAMIL
jgi:hypothetical protein